MTLDATTMVVDEHDLSGYVDVPRTSRAGTPLWQEADLQLRAINKRRGGLEVEEARWLLIAYRLDIHLKFGKATFWEYIEHVLGHGPHAGRDRLRVAFALETLPQLRAALAAGDVSYCAVRELVRIVKPETEEAWLERVRGKTVRDVETMLSGHKEGDLPTDPTSPDLRRHRVSFDLDGEGYAVWREAMKMVAEEHDAYVDDAETLVALCRLQLDGGGGGESGPRHQIALTTCASCQRTWQNGAGRAIEVAPEVLEQACCDAVHIGRVDADTPARATQDIPPAVRRLVFARDQHRCVVPGCRAARFLCIHHLLARAAGGTHDLANLSVVCQGHHDAIHKWRTLTITGKAPDLTFSFADGTVTHVGRDAAAVAPPTAPKATHPHAADVASALRNLGHDAASARAAVDRAVAAAPPGCSCEDLFKLALQAPPAPASMSIDEMAADVRSALVNAGFQREVAHVAVAHAVAQLPPTATIDELIRLAFQMTRKPLGPPPVRAASTS